MKTSYKVIVQYRQGYKIKASQDYQGRVYFVIENESGAIVQVTESYLNGIEIDYNIVADQFNKFLPL